MKTQQCDECRHFGEFWLRGNGYTNPCTQGHHPRFYRPKNPMDTTWGWKKKCKDFEEIKDE
jgi:hypothetical protein